MKSRFMAKARKCVCQVLTIVLQKLQQIFVLMKTVMNAEVLGHAVCQNIPVV